MASVMGRKSFTCATSQRLPKSTMIEIEKANRILIACFLKNRPVQIVARPVAIAVEQVRGALIYALMHVEFLHIYPVNPQTLAKVRQAFYPSGAKDDPRDADLLLEVLLTHRQHLRVWVPDDVLTRSIQLLTEGRRHLVDERTALANQLTAALKTYFPQALDWFGDVHTARACAFLHRWPSLH